jgi:hypothetical protein
MPVALRQKSGTIPPLATGFFVKPRSNKELAMASELALLLVWWPYELLVLIGIVLLVVAWLMKKQG